MSACEFCRWLICSIGHLHRRIVGQGSKPWCASDVCCPAKESFFLQTLSCRSLWNFIARVFHSCPRHLILWTLNVSFHWSRTIENLRIKEFSVRERRDRKKREKKGKEIEALLSVKHCLSIELAAINFIYRLLVSVTFCSLSQLPRRAQIWHFPFLVTSFGESSSWLALPLPVCLLILFFLDCMWDITHQYDYSSDLTSEVSSNERTFVLQPD